MSASQSLAPRPPASLETVHNILGSLVARYRQEEVLTAIGKFLPEKPSFGPYRPGRQVPWLMHIRPREFASCTRTKLPSLNWCGTVRT